MIGTRAEQEQRRNRDRGRKVTGQNRDGAKQGWSRTGTRGELDGAE